VIERDEVHLTAGAGEIAIEGDVSELDDGAHDSCPFTGATNHLAGDRLTPAKKLEHRNRPESQLGLGLMLDGDHLAADIVAPTTGSLETSS
jgi:hypothetical protein